MFQSERKSQSAAVPPPAAESAAGIASFPCEDQRTMPAASFFEAPIPVSAVRQHAIGAEQCRWIVADECAGADALMCGAPVARRRPFCAEHCAQAYEKPVEEEAEETQTAAQDEVRKEEKQEAAE